MNPMEWLNKQFAEIGDVLTGAGGIALAVFILYKVFKSGGALAAVLSAVIVAAIIWWAFQGGYEDFSEMISNWSSTYDDTE